ncbi:hypothetical protein N7478_001905 [Penicillium angulare]|uniref:uncharacterized protein n=1 Tax=Penicillium angulare TaxID=116970 RepID=UPI00253FF6EB|nr:uncharacterized protein N7478_001905 [Penicillium angulare]KAJ5288875.1 hypothetical protein N7478_001905 [Penicillium angulare]
MSKRIAEGPQGTKDDINPFGMGTPDEKPQRATAAQLASRKIKDVRKRPRGTTPNAGMAAPAPSGGAFSSLSAAPAFSSPGFTAPSTQSTGFNFGQSQSFPGGTSTPSQPAQADSAPFSFGGGGGGGGGGQPNFSFSGFGTSSSAPASNPFATNSFGADNSAPSQPAQTPGFSFGGFGDNKSTSQSQPPPFSFGGQQTAGASTGLNLFGQSATNNGSANPAADSMQMSPDAKPKGPTSTSASSFQSRNIFGDSAAPNLFSPKPTPASTASNPFGNLTASANADKPSSDKPEGFAAKPAFASQAPVASAPAQPFGSLFGSSSPATTATSELDKSASTAFSFSPATSKPAESEKVNASQESTQSKPFGSLFGATSAFPSASQPEKVNGTSSAPTNMFSAKPAEQSPFNPFAPKQASEQDTASPKPSSSLFGSSSPASQATPSVFAPKPSTEQAPQSSLFTPKPPVSEPTATNQNVFAGLSAFKPAAEQATSNNLFAPKSTTSEPPTASAQPVFNMLGQKPAAEPASTKSSGPQPSKSVFGTPSETPKVSETSQTFGNLTSSNPAAGNLFSPKPATKPASKTPVEPSSSNPFSGLSANTPTSIASTPKPPQPEPKPSQNFPDASAIPVPDFGGDISEELRDQAELLWKLRSLDVAFKQKLLEFEPGEYLFDDLLIFYLKARASMGFPVKSRKPKSDTKEQTPRQKKPSEKFVDTNGTSGSATSNIFAKSFSSPSSSPAKENAVSTSPQKVDSASSLNIFGNSASTSASPTTNGISKAPALTGNMFAKSQATIPSDSSSSPAAPKATGNIFASPQTSKAPASAPPAVPKFGNGAAGGGDFMSQFAKKVEQSAAEEKAKRKAEDFDSDEDDEAEWERRDAAEQEKKRAKLQTSVTKKAVWVEGEGFKMVDVTDEAAPSPTEKSPVAAPSPAPSSSASIFESTNRPLSNSENIFGRLSATPQPTDDDASDDEAKPTSPKRGAEDDDGDSSDFAAAVRKSKRAKPSETETTKSSLDTPIPAPTAEASKSLFARVESPAPSQDSSATPKANPFASLGTSSPFGAASAPAPTSTLFGATDNTWKPNSPIKFSGVSTPASTSAPTPSGGETSGNVTESNDDDAAPGAVFNLAEDAGGEPGEESVYKCRARAFMLTKDKGWASQGTGYANLLVNQSGRARIIIRSDPSGSIILNTLLKKDIEYERTAKASIQFFVLKADGPIEQWAIRVKADIMQAFHDKIQEIKN